MITHKQSKNKVQEISEYLYDAGVPAENVEKLAYEIFGIFKPIRKEHIDRLKVDMLKRAAKHVIDTKTNQFRKSELGLIDLGQHAYGRFGALRFHGLIAKVKDKQTQKVIQGEWLITPLGWSFLRGERAINKWVIMQDNHIRDDLDRGPLVKIMGIYKGADYIQTDFEYFDDDGNMVGLRPSRPEQFENRQASLL